MKVTPIPILLDQGRYSVYVLLAILGSFRASLVLSLELLWMLVYSYLKSQLLTFSLTKNDKNQSRTSP